MEYGDPIVEQDGNPRSCTLTHHGPQGLQQRFHLSPSEIARYRLRKDCLKDPLMTPVHDFMISFYDSFVKLWRNIRTYRWRVRDAAAAMRGGENYLDVKAPGKTLRGLLRKSGGCSLTHLLQQHHADLFAETFGNHPRYIAAAGHFPALHILPVPGGPVHPGP